MAYVETGTADFQSTITNMSGFTFTGGVDAAVVNLREGGVGGTIKYIVKSAINTTTHLDFSGAPVRCNNSAGAPQLWYVDLVSGTTPQMSITGT